MKDTNGGLMKRLLTISKMLTRDWWEECTLRPVIYPGTIHGRASVCGESNAFNKQAIFLLSRVTRITPGETGRGRWGVWRDLPDIQICSHFRTMSMPNRRIQNIQYPTHFLNISLTSCFLIFVGPCLEHFFVCLLLRPISGAFSYLSAFYGSIPCTYSFFTFYRLFLSY